MGLRKNDLMGEQSGPEISAISAVSCSICLESVTDNKDRSTAKLQCGHEFHLDCIGSAFNAKGVMQCPNCRKIEKGQWLYASGYHPYPGFSMDDWTPDEDFYDLSYSELAFGVNWCPFGSLTRPSMFEDGESPSTSYRDLLRHQGVFSEHAGSSTCPFVAYVQLLQPSSSNSHENVPEGSSIHHHWNGHSETRDNLPMDVASTVDLQNIWEHHSHETWASGVDQASWRTRPDPEILRARMGSAVVPPVAPLYHGNSRGLSRVHHHAGRRSPSFSGTHGPVFSGARANDAQATPTGSTASEHSPLFVFPPGTSGRNFSDPDSSVGNSFYAWERDRFAPYPLVQMEREANWWGPMNHGAVSETNGRSVSWQMNGSGRPFLQSRTGSTSSQAMHLGQHPYL